MMILDVSKIVFTFKKFFYYKIISDPRYVLPTISKHRLPRHLYHYLPLNLLRRPLPLPHDAI